MYEVSFNESTIRRNLRREAERVEVMDYLRNAVAGLRHVELTYVDYRDEFSERQVDAYLAGDWDTLYATTDEWTDDQRYDSAVQVINDLLEGEDFEFFHTHDDLDPDDEDEIRFAIYDKDQSDPIKGLARNTPDQLFRVTIATPGQAWYLMNDKEYDQAAAWVAGQLYGAGVPLLPAARLARELLNECGNFVHDGHQLDVIWHGSIENVAGLVPGDRLTFHGAHVLLIDTWNGSGSEVDVDHKVNVTLTDEHRPHLDRTGGYGWDAISGLVKSGYSGEPTVTKKEV